MKKLLLLILIINLVACDSLLDVKPSDKYSSDTFWLDEEQFNAGLTGCYNSLYNYQTMFNGWLDNITPNAFEYKTDDPGTGTVVNGSANASLNLFRNFWRHAYGGIGRANTLLDKIDDASFPEAKRKQMKGEALFIRALYYSILADLFGDCPLIIETPDKDKHGNLSRNPKGEVVDQIIKDLDEAANLLSIQASNTGRATKGAALALKARVLLYNEKWKEAAQAAKEVIELGIYDLFPDYRGLFLPENENNQEVIFDIQYKVPHFSHRLDNLIKDLNSPAPSKEFVDAYLMTDGKSINDSPLYNPETPYENRDPRLHQTVVCIGYPYNGRITTPADVTYTGFGQKKYTSFSDDETIVITQGNSEVNFIVLRYAEVLLTYAEALNEENEIPESEVFWAINQIRKRPTVNMPDVTPGLNKEQIRNIIRLERRIELAAEGLYYADIRRWGIAEIVNNQPIHTHEGKVIDNRSFNKNRDYLWPIPAVEIDENPQLVQNPGW